MRGRFEDTVIRERWGVGASVEEIATFLSASIGHVSRRVEALGLPARDHTRLVLGHLPEPLGSRLAPRAFAKPG